MFRALNAGIGVILFFTGATLVLLTGDGGVPLGIGALMLSVDLLVERRQEAER